MAKQFKDLVVGDIVEIIHPDIAKAQGWKQIEKAMISPIYGKTYPQKAQEQIRINPKVKVTHSIKTHKGTRVQVRSMTPKGWLFTITEEFLVERPDTLKQIIDDL